MRFLGVIPARYNSSRFPGKPLAVINGKTMIQRVFEQASKVNAFEAVYVATDDQRIYDHVLSFGGQVYMTDSDHPSGTDRCHEVVQLLQKEEAHFDVVVNIQGDEPYINPQQIMHLLKAFDNNNTQIATLVKEIAIDEEIDNPNAVKVVRKSNGEALYFSRYAIPFIQDRSKAEKEKLSHYKHIGIYAYRCDILSEICKLPKSELEKAESLEQLRWLENGYNIQTILSEFESVAVDSPADLLKLTNKT